MLSVVILSVVMLSVVMLSVVMLSVVILCRYAEYLGTSCHTLDETHKIQT